MTEATAAAMTDILAERERQKNEENWTEEHDDEHVHGELAAAAAMYALGTTDNDRQVFNAILQSVWPWDVEWWKPTDAERDLIKAGALIMAELERIRRAKRSNDEKSS